MKLISRAFVTAALFALPSVAQAQYDVQLTLTSQTIVAGAGGRGGQFAGSATGLGALLAYCIDQDRNIQNYNVAATYRVFTFTEYVNTFLAPPAPTSTFASSAYFEELRQFAANASTIALGAGGAADMAQDQTWAWFRTAANQGTLASLTNEDQWRVLVSVDAINNPRQFAGYQTMITAVPEPSTYVLMASGLALVGLVARRRKVS